jgi:branched-chain amino acid transport system permease protein
VSYLLHILFLVEIYAVLAASLNLLAGYTGLLSLCTAAFFGVGAYTSSLLVVRLGWPWLAALGTALLLAGLLAAVVGGIALRFRGDFFVIASFAFQIIATSVLLNWAAVTQGPLGLAGIPPPDLFGWSPRSRGGYLFLGLAFAAVALAALLRLVRSPYGRLLEAIREDEVLARSLGKDVLAAKRSAFVCGAAIAALAGGLYAPYVSYIDPASFTVQESIFVLAVVILGGAGHLWGSVLGAAFLVAVPEALRLLDLSPSVAAQLRQILYGLLLMASMIWRPQGIGGRFRFEERA